MNITRKSIAALATMMAFGLATDAVAARKFEYLDRGVVAVRQNNSNALVTWRSLASDEDGLGFNVYRVTSKDTVKLTGAPVTKGTNFVDSKADFSKANTYFVKKVLNGKELETKGSYTMPANKGVGPYVTVPIKAGTAVHFVWVGDLDGDGAYDYVLDRPIDDEQKLEAYSSTGKYLWTLNLGPNSANKNNITPGASTLDVGMWDGATVYDIDSDGYAEVIVRIADGVTFGDGKKFSLSGTNAQVVAVLDGRTGALKATAPVPNDYIKIGPMAAMMEIGYLDGVNPSVVCWFKNRNADKSFNSLMVAYGYQNGKFVQRWKYDAGKQGGGAEAHQIRIADVDYDGKDEVLHMGYALNGDGTLRYKVPVVVHGDRWYVGAFNKGDKEMMGYGIQQDHPNNLLEYYYNASTGKLIWTHYGDESCAGQCDVARGNVGDIDPNYAGLEVWSFQGTYNGQSDKLIASNYLYPVIRYWWDGDLGAESYNDGKIENWNYENKTVERQATTWKIYGSSGSERGAAMFHGDVFGDWREESILVNYETNELVIFTTDIASDYKFYTHMQNPCYRNGTTTKGYVQASMLDYYLGWDMDTPKKPDIEIIGGEREPSFADAVVTLTKCGAGSSNQSINLGDPIGDFCYTWTGNGEVTAEGFPKGIRMDVDKSAKKVSVSGTPAEAGSFSFTVTITGADDSFKKSGSIQVVDLNASSSSTVSESSSSASDDKDVAESSSSDENESSSSSEVTQALSQDIAGAATKFNARFSGNNIILNSVPNGSYTISVFDMQGHRIQNIQNAYGNEINVQLNRGTYLIRISQDGRTLGMFRAIKQK